MRCARVRLIDVGISLQRGAKGVISPARSIEGSCIELHRLAIAENIKRRNSKVAPESERSFGAK